MELNLKLDCHPSSPQNGQKPAAVGVVADAGVWHLGALHRRGTGECKHSLPVLDRSCLTEEQLEPFKAIVMPGGWSVFQRAAAGKEGLDAIRSFRREGRHVSRRLCRSVSGCQGCPLAGRNLPLPTYLFDGIAEGSLPEVAAWPKAGGVRVKVTAAGCRRGIGSAGEGDFHYKGGPRFVGGTRWKYSHEYADGTAAIIARPFGKGEVVLNGRTFRTSRPNGWWR